jgi:hypothetical protein
MQTFVFSPQTEDLPVKVLLSQTNQQSIAFHDSDGKLVAYVLSPAEHEALALAEARIDLQLHQAEVQAARQRRGGVTTSEMLKRAQAAAEQQSKK